MTLSFSARHRLGEFSLDAAFEAGEGVTALFGPSGSGKTTINNIIAGLIRPQAAKVMLGGEPLNDTERRLFLRPERRRVGYVFQEGRLFPHLTVKANLLFGAQDDQSLARTAALLGLERLLTRFPNTLSGGEKQRTALGRALLSSPRLLLLDEPFAAVDAARKEEVMPYLKSMIAETRIPVLYVSHAREEVAAFAQRVVRIAGGRVEGTISIAEFATT